MNKGHKKFLLFLEKDINQRNVKKVPEDIWKRAKKIKTSAEKSRIKNVIL